MKNKNNLKVSKLKYSAEDQEINFKLYDAFLSADLDDGWNRADKKENFEIFKRIEELAVHQMAKSTILDVGCGTGDLYGFLEKIGFKKYLGIDIFEYAVNKARIKYPKGEFQIGDFLNLDLPKFDYVLSSGALTTKLKTDNYQILKSWVSKMWALSKKGMALNLLLERYPGDNSPNLFVYNRQKVLEIISTISDKTKLTTITTDAGSGDSTEEMHIFLYR